MPQRMEQLLQLPGVARDSQCGSRSCLRIHVGVTVDTHVKRLSYRLGLTALQIRSGLSEI